MKNRPFRSGIAAWRWLGLLPLAASLYGNALAGEPAQAGILVKQKLLLLESLLNSERIRQLQASGGDEARNRVANAVKLRDQARSWLAGGDIGAAAKAVDESLRTATAVSAAAKSAPLLDNQWQQKQNADLEQQVRGYRTAIGETLKKQGKTGDARLQGLDRLLAEAAGDTAAERHGEANRKLAQAYRLAVTMLSELRAGETVVLDLKFDTPADEYAYEQKRNRSHEMLVEMMVQEGKAEGSNRARFDQLVEAGRQLRLKAESMAETGDYKGAIEQLENATGQLVKALQLTGMPVF
ncbi:MAG TPA: hypothetical protein VGK14_09120 [Novimethylophilus sp.]|jgi:hypothetical protein|uniref:hypothetical protein n=1 Tax=Novimethylophilus sp. TaxID=2137426 RepID=UPI002F3FD76A